MKAYFPSLNITTRTRYLSQEFDQAKLNHSEVVVKCAAVDAAYGDPGYSVTDFARAFLSYHIVCTVDSAYGDAPGQGQGRNCRYSSALLQ